MFYEVASAPPEKLHQRSQSQSYFLRSQSPTEHALSENYGTTKLIQHIIKAWYGVSITNGDIINSTIVYTHTP
jgi:hypothetical protein